MNGEGLSDTLATLHTCLCYLTLIELPYTIPVSIWPVRGVINKLPPSKGICTIKFGHMYFFRFLRQHMLLLGIFYSSDKPLLNTFLRPMFINKVSK